MQGSNNTPRPEVEESLDTLALYLDGLFRIPGLGWRFGLDALVGLIPNVGDLATSLVSFYILIAGVRHGVPKITLVRMALNIAVDYVVGSIPFVGDIFDVFWKSNQRNVELIRQRATGTRVGTRSDYIFVGGILVFLSMLLLASIAVSVAVVYAVVGWVGDRG